MRLNMSMGRAAVAGLVLVGVVAGSGCSWFRKGDGLYSQNPESRPLEVPPDLDLPRTDAAVDSTTGSVMASGQGAGAPVATGAATAGAANTSGFTMAGSRDDAFNKVGEVLAATAGVSIASRAQLLGAFDVNYEGSNFLVRVSAVEAGAYVSAVDPRGMPATGEAPVKLIAALKASLGGN